MSSISGSVQWSTHPDIDVFHLRGRLLKAGSPMYVATVSAITSVAARTSSASTPPSGQVGAPAPPPPGQRAVQHAAGGVAAGLRRRQADRAQPLPDLGHVLD